MMTCRMCRDQLSAYREGELADPLRKELEAHLSGCAECRAELAALEQMIRQMKALPPVPVPADFRSRVWQRIEKESGLQRLRRTILEPWYWKLPVEALATAAVVLIVAQVVRVTGPEKMAMAPPLQEAVEMKPAPAAAPPAIQLREKAEEEIREPAATNQDGLAVTRKMEVPVVAAKRQEMKQARSEQAQRSSLSAAGMAADQAVLRTDIELDLFAPDLAQARKELAELISRTPGASVSVDEEKDDYFISLPDEQIDAFLINLFEIGSFEPTRADSGLSQARRAVRLVRIRLRLLEP